MSALHLVRLPLQLPALLRFAADHGVTHRDDGLGYTLHLWLTALFGENAPKPFRYFDQRREVLGYTRIDVVQLLDHARAFAPPAAWTALDVEGVASKPMPQQWRAGQRLNVEALVCPVERRGDEEKDAYLRALDRLGDSAPSRPEVYQQWFIVRWEGALALEHIEMRSMRARSSLVRRARNDKERLVSVERPQALFAADATIVDADRFNALLARGIGRHRAFGFGMVLLAPAR